MSTATMKRKVAKVHLSDEHKAKISASLKGRKGLTPWNVGPGTAPQCSHPAWCKGQHLSKETKQKISESVRDHNEFVRCMKAAIKDD